MGEALMPCRGGCIERGTITNGIDNGSGLKTISASALVNVRNAIIFLNGDGTGYKSTNTEYWVTNVVIEDGEVTLAIRANENAAISSATVSYNAEDGSLTSSTPFCYNNSTNKTPIYDYIVFN